MADDIVIDDSFMLEYFKKRREKEVSDMPTAIPAHGLDGLFNAPGLDSAEKKRKKKKDKGK